MTKVVKYGFSLAVIGSIIFSGCNKSQPAPSQVQKTVQPVVSCSIKGEDAPDWICMPHAEGSIVAVGIAKPNSADDLSMQRAEAMADARDALARQIETKVANMFKKYVATTGAGKAQTYEKATQNVSKQIAKQTLKGTKQLSFWQHPKTGEIFLLVGVQTKSVEEGMEDAIKTTFKNDNALYQEFKAQKAQGELDKELEKYEK